MSEVKTASAPFCKACHHPLDAAKAAGCKDGFDLLVCPQCGTVTISPFPTHEDLIKFYQDYKDKADYRAKQDKKIRRSLRRIKRMIRLTSGNRFLDVGCNYGFAVMAALRLGLDARGIDIDGAAIENNKKVIGGYLFSATSVEEYAAQGHKVDMLYTSEVIEHVPNPDAFVKSLSTLLAPGGILYLTTPDAGHFAVPRRLETWKEIMPPEHITYFTRRGLTHLFEKHGLKVRKFFFCLKPSLRVLAEKI
ncbi:MAG: class I SAM-dependent methyltransferase [Bdellovibrionales bacterium]